MATTRDTHRPKLSWRPDSLADALGVSRRTIIRWVEAGRLDAVRPSPNTVLITDESVRELLAGER